MTQNGILWNKPVSELKREREEWYGIEAAIKIQTAETIQIDVTVLAAEDCRLPVSSV